MKELFSYCTLMFIGSMFSGLIPLAFSVRKSHLRVLIIFGAGLLFGSATLIVIPEGIERVYQEKRIAAKVNESNVLMGDSEVHMHSENNSSESIGYALTMGFCLMLMIDRFSHIFSTSSLKSNPSDRHIDENSSSPKDITSDQGKAFEVDANVMELGKDDKVIIGSRPSFDTLKMKREANSILIGLFIHGLSDGIALGSSLGGGESKSSNVGFMVFLAIIVHKGPSAFGLVSTLLHLGLPKFSARNRLFLFSLATPLGTVLAYAFSRTSLTANPKDTFMSSGNLLVFSGGTFLFVSTMHVLPGLFTGNHHGEENHRSILEVDESCSKSEESPFSKIVDLAIWMFGVYFPLLLANYIMRIIYDH